MKQKLIDILWAKGIPSKEAAEAAADEILSLTPDMKAWSEKIIDILKNHESTRIVGEVRIDTIHPGDYGKIANEILALIPGKEVWVREKAGDDTEHHLETKRIYDWDGIPLEDVVMHNDCKKAGGKKVEASTSNCTIHGVSSCAFTKQERQQIDDEFDWLIGGQC